MATQWHICCLADTTNLPVCVVLLSDILEARGDGNSMQVKNLIKKKIVSVLMLTNMKCMLVYNMKQHKHCCSERRSPKLRPPEKEKRYRLHPGMLTTETEELKMREREAMTRFSGIAV